MDYTVVRPGSLTDSKRPKDACLVRKPCSTNVCPDVSGRQTKDQGVDVEGKQATVLVL